MKSKVGIFAMLIILLYVSSLTTMNTDIKQKDVMNFASPITPEILEYKIINGSSSINLNSNGSYYIYTAVDGGGVPVTNYNFNIVGSVINGNSVDSALTGYSHLNNGSYDHDNAAYYGIAGISIGSSYGINKNLKAYYSYSVNGSSDASFTNLTFSVNNSNSLVVIVSAGSIETSAKLIGNFNIEILDSFNSSYFSVVQGYSILNPGNYDINVTMTPTQGPNVNPNGAGIILAVYIFPQSYFYVPSKYNVNFIETGLSSGTTWYVTVDNITQSSQDNVISFSLYNGSYQYKISMAGGLHPNPSYGNIYVNGSSLNISVEFLLPNKYIVAFQPSGLNPGSVYSVTIDNLTKSAYGNQSLTFMLINGTYDYKVTSPDGYITSMQSGIVQVSGNNVNVFLQFYPVKYTISIVESGLPPGTTWWINFDNQNYTSEYQTINISAPDGNYVLNFPTIQGFKPGISNVKVKVDNSNVIVKVSYSFVEPSNISVLDSPTYLLIISIFLFIVLGFFVFSLMRGVKNGL